MIKKQSLSKNFMFQFLYQGLILVIPLVISPYLTRTLQESALGIYSYVNSIAYYFLIVAMLGIMKHGQRIISQSINDYTKLRKVFWSLFSVHVVISLVVFVAYMFFSLIIVKSDRNIYIIESLYVLSALFDVTWLFYGLENFQSVVVKNTVVKITQCILIFTLIKNSSDLWIYTLIVAAGTLGGQLVMIPQAIQIIKPIKFGKEDVKQHIKPLLVFSIAVIASTMYTVFDKTLLGLLTNKDNVAFYEYSNKIINVPKMLAVVIGTVMYPRACKMAASGNTKGQKKYMRYSFLFTSMISMAAIFGLISVANDFAVIYFGKSFAICGRVMMVMSPLVYIIGTGDVIRSQYMIPNKMDIQYNVCIILNAIVNLIISLLLIPKLGIYGAIIGTTSAEIFGLMFQMILCRKFIEFGDIVKSLIPFAIIGTVMTIIIKIISNILTNTIRVLLVEVLIGGCVYIFGCLLYFVIFEKDISNVILKKLRIIK